MHAQAIIQDLLDAKCPSMHAKRRHCLALMTDCARRGGLGLLKMSRKMDKNCPLRYRIKRCDRLLSNEHLVQERIVVFRALAHSVLQGKSQIGIIVDWSNLLADSSQHLLRAAVMVDGRSLTIYEEIHPDSGYGTPEVHRSFMQSLRTVLPDGCEPVIVTDAGFRATWFNMLNELGFSWLGRIRNRDTVRKLNEANWQGCKTLYASTRGHARNLGDFDYTQTNRVRCRLVMISRKLKGRKRKTVTGKNCLRGPSQKQRKSQREPWLLAASPSLSKLSASAVVALYGRRMQIEQTFRDIKSVQFGMGLSSSQTYKPKRLTILLLIAALLSFSLWLIGLTARREGFSIGYGSKKKVATTLSVLSLARHWIDEVNPPPLKRRQINDALIDLASCITDVHF